MGSPNTPDPNRPYGIAAASACFIGMANQHIPGIDALMPGTITTEATMGTALTMAYIYSEFRRHWPPGNTPKRQRQTEMANNRKVIIPRDLR